MEKNKKPIENIKDDLQSVIFSVEKLHNDINELREINKDILDKLTNHLSKVEEINKDYIKVEKEIKNKSWFF